MLHHQVEEGYPSSGNPVFKKYEPTKTLLQIIVLGFQDVIVPRNSSQVTKVVAKYGSLFHVLESTNVFEGSKKV